MKRTNGFQLERAPAGGQTLPPWAAALCGGLTAREKNCILAHMWPLSRRAPRSREAAAVCLADKLCATAEVLGYWRRSRVREKAMS